MLSDSEYRKCQSMGTDVASVALGITVTMLGIVLLVVALFNFLHVRASLDTNRYHQVSL
jgi:uncharacterized membrane protein YidH (DUF202 family)